MQWKGNATRLGAARVLLPFAGCVHYTSDYDEQKIQYCEYIIKRWHAETDADPDE